MDRAIRSNHAFPPARRLDRIHVTHEEDRITRQRALKPTIQIPGFAPVVSIRVILRKLDAKPCEGLLNAVSHLPFMEAR